ncbi:MAG: hypothetical protein JO166_20095 [Deltaproteobacteria bacterium]|nr:hypothetical protein [Deltaproteobacteria bacterium]
MKKPLSVALMFLVLSMSTISGLTLAGSKPRVRDRASRIDSLEHGG